MGSDFGLLQRRTPRGLVPDGLLFGNGVGGVKSLLWLSWYLAMVSVTPLLCPASPAPVGTPLNIYPVI